MPPDADSTTVSETTRLVRHLQRSRGQFSLAFVRGNDPGPEADLAALLRQQCPELRITEVRLGDRHEAVQPLYTLQATLEQQPSTDVLLIYGLEKAFPAPDEPSDGPLPVLVSLNLQRDSYRHSLPAALVFCTPDRVLDAIAGGAPDFWSWRSGVFALDLPPSDPATATQPSACVRLVRIFVSSPGDVAEERRVLDEVIDRINRTDGRAWGVRLELWKWEDDAVPQIGPRPQEVVDAQTPADYDVYLGILAYRFGTPTGRSGSGTEKEFRNALRRWGKTQKPWILYYFKTAKVDPDQLDLDQYAKVRKFRETVQKKGLCATYDQLRGSASGFFEQVDTHLRNVIRALAPSVVEATETARPKRQKTAPEPGVPRAYLQWLQRQCASVDLLGLGLKEGRVLRLNQVYVPLATLPVEQQKGKKKRPPEPDPEQREKPQLLLDLLDKQSLYVSGDPGSGKSTFCRWTGWLCCEGELPNHQVQAAEEYRERFPESLRGRLPILVRLRDFFQHLPRETHREDLTRSSFEQSLRRWLEKTEPDALNWDTVQWHLEHGSALLVFDGVDEVPISQTDETGDWHARAMLLSGLAEAGAAWTRAGNRLLVTSRPYGLRESDRQRLGLQHAPIQDLSPPLQDLLVRRWFHILVEPDEAAEGYAQDMLQHVREREGLDQLVTNPMLLTATCILFNEGKRLPQDKHDLYARIVDNVLYNRFRDQATIDKVRNRLCVVAYGMHTGAGLDEDRRTPQAGVTFDEINRMLESYRQQRRYTDAGYQDLVECREQLLSQTGLLLPRGPEQASFYHLSIQEFLAAQRAWDLDGDQLADVFRRRAAVPEWHNTLTFLFGAQLTKSSDPDRSIRLVETLIDAVQPDELGLQVVLGECLDMLLGKKIRLQAPEEKFRQLCLDAIQREVPLRERQRLGLILGNLGDPRIVPDLRKPAAYVEIPAGEYAYQDGRQTVKTPFRISRYPVTNSQFALFLAEGGYEKAAWWSEEGWQWREAEHVSEPLYWRHPKWNNPNQPVVGVSFWEAEAFCKWAGGRLPTERDWEAAARGPEAHGYPWGGKWEDGICNTREAGLGVTTPGGLFPRSRSQPFGLEDMAGNVWEWCADRYSEGDVGRVVRGGCWANTGVDARSADRNGSHPGFRYPVCGFRVVSAFSPGLA